jgi:hypothetical protein
MVCFVAPPATECAFPGRARGSGRHAATSYAGLRSTSTRTKSPSSAACCAENVGVGVACSHKRMACQLVQNVLPSPSPSCLVLS